MNVLISAFTIGPYEGSEPGLGWQWITHIANYCNVFVICGDEYKKDVDCEYAKLPNKSNIFITYNNIPPKVIKMANNQGDWRFYYYLKQWEKKTYEIAKDICKKHHIDIIHHLNITAYREPGYLWKIDGPKYVWGPVGGMILCPIQYIKGMDTKIVLKYRLKNILNNIQFALDRRVRKAAMRSDLVFFDSDTGVRKFKQKFGIDGVQINETGCVIRESIDRAKVAGEGECLDLLWAGRFIPTKLLNLAIQAIAMVDRGKAIKLHILGSGSNQTEYKNLAKDLGVSDRIIWHGQVAHNEVEIMMRQSDLFFFTSVVEGTPACIMECITNGLPILCFDTCGFGPLVNENIGIKIQLSNPIQSAREFAERIEYLFDNREVLKNMSKNCASIVRDISWEALSLKLVRLYEQILVK